MNGNRSAGSWDGWRAHIGTGSGAKSTKANSFLSGWYHRVKESYVAAWFCRVFQTGRMSSTPGGGGGAGAGSGGGAVGGALSLMGCVREASPPPQDHHPLSLGDFGMQRSVDTLPKEPKKRRFHPLRGLRRIFRRKSRGAADARLSSRNGDRDSDLINRDREEVTLRHPAGRPEEARSRSASELLTDSCDRERRLIGWPRKYRVATTVRTHMSFNNVFLRRSGVEESFAKLRGGAGQLSVSHDSVFPGEVPHTRPLSSLDPLATLERRQSKASDEGVHKDYTRVPHNNRISLRVLEQIKTVIENRNQLASATSTESTHAAHAVGERYQQETTENRFTHFERHDRTVEESLTRVTRISDDVTDRETSPKEDLPQLECASLNHTAAHHRISVRPKNRRPPRRAGMTTAVSGPAIATIAESDAPDSLEPAAKSSSSSPVEKKNSPALRKSSSRLSRNSDIFEELESKLPLRKPASTASLSPDSLDSVTATGKVTLEQPPDQPEDRESISSHEIKPVSRKLSSRVSKGSEVYDELEAKLPRRRSSSSRLSKSPDSLESSPASFSKSTEGFDKLSEHEESRHGRKLQNSMSKSTEGFEKLVEHVEIRPVSRRLYNHQMSKSIEGFERLVEDEEIRLPVRRYSNVVTSKSNEGPLKCADSLEAIETMISDDSIERRRSSFELRPRKSPPKLISISSENFEALEDSRMEESDVRPELQKRSSASDVNLTRARRYSKLSSKSTESFEAMEVGGKTEESNRSSVDLGKGCWRSSKRVALSSESSDNLELEDRLENRRARRPPKRIPSTSVVDIFPAENPGEDERRPTPTRKTHRVKKSSESSELGSTDTLDSERRNKSSDSTETLDSLEKDVEREARDDEVADSLTEKRDKNDSWSAKTMGTEMEPAGDLTEDSNRSPIVSPDKSYWRQTSDSKENIDIHQLLAITIVTRMADNGNNQRNNTAAYPKKKQQQISSPPSSPVVQQDDNKMIFNNLLASKNDEDLQNMLNGNISEVSTDTKSFKEKLIMFEKLGK